MRMHEKKGRLVSRCERCFRALLAAEGDSDPAPDSSTGAAPDPTPEQAAAPDPPGSQGPPPFAGTSSSSAGSISVDWFASRRHDAELRVLWDAMLAIAGLGEEAQRRVAAYLAARFL